MAEKQAAHRQDLESRALKGDLVKSMMGTILAYITFAGSMFGARQAHTRPRRPHRSARFGLRFENLCRLRSTEGRASKSTITTSAPNSVAIAGMER